MCGYFICEGRLEDSFMAPPDVRIRRLRIPRPVERIWVVDPRESLVQVKRGVEEIANKRLV
jgi:hypothetical protein